MNDIMNIPSNEKNKKDLKRLIAGLDCNVFNLKTALWNICKILYEIDKKKLYFLDECSSISAFTKKRIQSGKLQITLSSIKNYLALMKDLDSQKLLNDKDVLRISSSKLYDLHRFGVKGKKQLLEHKDRTIKEIRNIFKEDKPKQNYRKNCKRNEYFLEIPADNVEEFESGLCNLMAKNDVRVI